MTAVAGREAICAVQVVIGVDTHKDEHVAVAVDQQGVRLAQCYAPATSYVYGQLERCSRSLSAPSGACVRPFVRFSPWGLVRASRLAHALGLENPAAAACPPPPCSRAMSATSDRPPERRLYLVISLPSWSTLWWNTATKGAWR